MTTTILVLGWIGWALLALGAVGFFITSLTERRWRPALLAVVVFAPVLAGYLALLLLPGAWGLPIGLIVGAVAVVVLVFPFGKPPLPGVEDEQEQVDERDAVFHRFYRLKPGMPEYKAYYADHPEKEAFDREVRNLPQLAGPGSSTYHSLTSNHVTAIFEVLENLTANIDWPAEPMDGEPVQASEAEFTQRIKGFAKYLGAADVGTTKLNQAYVYSHAARRGPWGDAIELDHANAIVVAVEMKYEMVKHAPDVCVTTESATRYFDVATIALILARYINRLGYEARGHVDGNYQVMCPPIAVDAGLGEVGRLGLLMHPKYGPRVRLAVVTTDLPLTHDQPINFGVQDFCAICLKCADCCPSESIDAGPRPRKVIKGARKWQTNGDTCYRFWRQRSSDCAICMRVCPYSHPRTPIHNLVRWGIRRNHFARRAALWGDDFFYGRKPVGPHPFPRWLDKR